MFVNKGGKMKKIIQAFILICLISLPIIAQIHNPSLDGRAIVAPKGSYPSGLYGKAPGFLPGDTLIVTSYTNGFSIEVLILSSIDTSSGIAIELSEEAAQALEISRNTDSYVKIQKKSAYQKEVIKTPAQDIHEELALDPDKTPSLALKQNEEIERYIEDIKATYATEDSPLLIVDSSEVIFDDQNDVDENSLAKSEDLVFETSELENTRIKDEPVLEILSIFDEADEVEEVAILEEINEAEEVAILEEIDEAEEVAILEEVDEAEEVAVLEEVDEMEEVAILEEVDEMEEVAILEEVDEAEEVAILEEVDEMEEVAILEEVDEMEEVAILEEIDEAEEVAVLEEVDEMEEVAILEEVDEMEEVAILEEIDEAEEVAILEGVDEAEEVAILEEVDEAEEVEEYEKVAVLEETEHVYPEETSEAKSIFDEIMSHLLVEAEEETYEEEIETLASDIFVSETSEENEDFIGIFDEGREETKIKGVEKEISSLDKLEKNKYYIQIATVKQESSLDSILKDYASKYPLEILDASGLYQILVGPFTDDEYKVVLERFKQREFKDAFVRHVK
ncbi:MAG TPA: hypothetical protein DDW88_01545 [Treponema sp.]|nr:hypothetical protein [Treponema sp.]